MVSETSTEIFEKKGKQSLQVPVLPENECRIIKQEPKSKPKALTQQTIKIAVPQWKIVKKWLIWEGLNFLKLCSVMSAWVRKNIRMILKGRGVSCSLPIFKKLDNPKVMSKMMAERILKIFKNQPHRTPMV